MIPAVEDFDSDLRELNRFVIDSKQLTDLEDLLGSFNLFQVLRAENNELRHSNVLGWLFDPEESHGLGDLFLQRWMMRVLHKNPKSAVSPAEIDGWALADVEVRREWRNIDLLLILAMPSGIRWAVCVENKINSAQHSDQLRRYRETVEAEFPDEKHLFIFLTRRGEEPQDATYLTATYEQVFEALYESVARRSLAIGSEPKILLDNYLRLLREKFMNKSQIAQLSRAIYKTHKRALDVIFEHTQGTTADEVALMVKALVDENADRLKITPHLFSQKIIRFTPKKWDSPSNQRGSAEWGELRPSILVEIGIRTLKKSPSLCIVIGRGTPLAWSEKIWALANEEKFPGIRDAQPKLNGWPTPYESELDVDSMTDDSIGKEELAQAIFEAFEGQFSTPFMQKAIDQISLRLPELDQLLRSPRA